MLCKLAFVSPDSSCNLCIACLTRGLRVAKDTFAMLMGPCIHPLRDCGLELQSSGQLDVSIGVFPMPWWIRSRRSMVDP